MADFTHPVTGETFKGLAAHNAKRKYEKELAAGPVPTPAPVAEAPAAAPSKGRPQVKASAEAPAAEEPAAPAQVPVELDYYNDILDAVQAHEKGFALQHKTETGQQYLARLLAAVLAVPESVLPWDDEKDQFSGLKDGSNAWIKAATEATNNDKPLPELSGFIDAFVASNGKDTGRRAKVKEPRAPKVPKEKKVRVPKEKKVRAPKEDGFVRKVRTYMVSNPDATLEQLKEEAAKWFPAGAKQPSGNTLALSRNGALQVINIVKAQGKWKEAT